MPQFKKLNTNIYAKKKAVETADSNYWNQFGSPVLVKEFGPIDYVNFSPIEPYYFAVTSSVRVQIYNPITKLVVKNFPRFRENAYGATFRSDGKLLCTGAEEAVVKLFNVQSKSLVRLFKGHTAPVHRTFFIPNKPEIVSFSDDKSVKLWDIPSEKCVLTFSEHADYVRAGAITSTHPDMILSGGYDNTINMYDVRTNIKVFSVNHGNPIESLLFLPSGGVFLSAGGTDIKIWDILSGGKLIGNISQHHKTITCLHLASDNKKLLSGSLDRHVKVYDTSNFKVVHTIDYPNAILSLGISKNDDTLVAGLVDGLISVKRREEKGINKSRVVPSYQYTAHTHAKIDIIVPEYKKPKEHKHDFYLRKFQYQKALLTCIPHSKKSPAILVEVMQELIRRKALARVFEACEDKIIHELLRFFIRNIADYRFGDTLIIAINIFLDVFQDKLHEKPNAIGMELKRLTVLVDREINLRSNLALLQGGIEMILASSRIMNANDDSKVLDNLVPSADAQKIPVVNLT